MDNCSQQNTKKLLIGMGAQKTGTTWLHYNLNRHPCYDCWFAKEWKILAGYRDLCIRQQMVERFEKNLERMKELKRKKKAMLFRRRAELLRNIDEVLPAKFAEFSGDTKRTVLADLTPANGQLSSFDLKHIMDLAAEYSLSPKFVFRMRDPLSRVLSGTVQVIKREVEKIGEKEHVRSTDLNDYIRRYGYRKRIFQRTCYKETVCALDEVAEEKDIHYRFCEDAGYSQAALTSCCEFLGIEPVPVFDRRFNPSPTNCQFDDETKKWVVNEMRPTYEFIRHRFGSKVEQYWGASMALLD